MPTSMVLRFRDLVADTIESHRALIKEHGYAWWGWWNKPDEKIPRATFATFREAIGRDGYIEIFLIDSGRAKLYKARLVDIDESKTEDLKSCSEPKKTPDYYSTAKYKAWFKLTDIRDAAPDEIREWSYEEITEFLDDPSAERFRDKRVFDVQEMLNRRHRTIYFIRPYNEKTDQDYRLEFLPPVSRANFIRSPIITNSDYILHISDLHFGTGYHRFALQAEPNRKKLSTLIIDDLRREYRDVAPAAVIVSGDLTWHGAEDEFEMVYESVKELESVFKLDPHRFVIVPGNHDIQWSDQDPNKFDREKPVTRASEEAEKNYRAFYKRFFGIAANEYLSMGRRYLLNNYNAVDIVGLNSCRLEQKPFAGYGYVSLEQVQDAAAEMGWDKGNKPESMTRILTLHHHVMPVTSKEELEYGRLYSLTLDAGQLTYEALKFGVDLAVHGHMHQPFSASLSRADKAAEIAKRTLGVHGAGSAGVKKDLTGDVGKNSFSVYNFEKQAVTIRIRSLSEAYEGFDQDWQSRFEINPDGGFRTA